MMLIFGGRNKESEPLNDLWGLRKHTVGTWTGSRLLTDKLSLLQFLDHSTLLSATKACSWLSEVRVATMIMI